MRQRRVNGMLRHLMKNSDNYVVIVVCRMERNVPEREEDQKYDVENCFKLMRSHNALLMVPAAAIVHTFVQYGAPYS